MAPSGQKDLQKPFAMTQGAMVEFARAIINKKERPLDPSVLDDRCSEALRDLMEAMRRSLKGQSTGAAEAKRHAAKAAPKTGEKTVAVKARGRRAGLPRSAELHEQPDDKASHGQDG